MDDIIFREVDNFMDNDTKRNIYVLRKKRERKKDGYGHDMIYYSDRIENSQVPLIRVAYGLAAEMDGGIHWELSLKNMEKRVYSYKLENARKDWSERVETGWVAFPIEKLCDKEVINKIEHILYRGV